MEDQELLEILRSARDLLADGSRWSPVHIATDENGRWVPVGNADATRFNLLGAVIRAAGTRARDAMKTTELALRKCSSDAFARTLTSSRPMTLPEALSWLDAAISLLATDVGHAPSATARTSTSGLMLKVSQADTAARQTTGTDGDDEQ